MPFKMVRYWELQGEKAKLAGAPDKVEWKQSDKDASVNTDFVVDIVPPKAKTQYGQSSRETIETPPNTSLLKFHDGSTRLVTGSVAELQYHFNNDSELVVA